MSTLIFIFLLREQNFRLTKTEQLTKKDFCVEFTPTGHNYQPKLSFNATNHAKGRFASDEHQVDASGAEVLKFQLIPLPT